MFNALTRIKLFLWQFGAFSVPMIGYLRPRIVHLDDHQAIIKIRLTRRSKNHLHSMYFGALATGADLAGGLHALYFSKRARLKNLSLVFKSFEARFLKRPEDDVYFICESGETVQEMINKTLETGERVNQKLPIRAVIHYPHAPEVVAEFAIELSLKSPKSIS